MTREMDSRETLRPWERVADIIFPLIGTLFVFGFFAAHH
jgi:hypothetical protein